MGRGSSGRLEGRILVAVATAIAPNVAAAADTGTPAPWTFALALSLGGVAIASLVRMRALGSRLREAELRDADMSRSLGEATERIADFERSRNELLGHTAATVREPLARLVSTLDTLARSPMLSFEARGAVDQAIRLGREASTGISALGDTARLRDGELHLDLMATDLRTCVDAALEAIRRRQEIVAPTFSVEADGEIPYVYADPERLTQVLTTLLGRAAQISPESAVGVRLRGGGEVVELIVEDRRVSAEPDRTLLTAPSLPSHDARLGQLDTIRLWIAGRILLHHGYAIQCEPRGGGAGFAWIVRVPRSRVDVVVDPPRSTSTVVDTLAPPANASRIVQVSATPHEQVALVPGVRRSPLAGALAPSALPRLDFSPDSERGGGDGPTRPRISIVPPASLTRTALESAQRDTLIPTSLKRKSAHVPDQMPTAPDPMLFRPRVLVADDDAVVRNVIAAELTELDVDVTMAIDGVDALARIQSEAPYDLILSDVIMPRLTGLQLCKIVRETHSAAELPILLMSAKSAQDDLVRAFDAGASDIIVKPSVKAELLQRVATHLQVSRETIALTRFVPREFLRLLGRERVADVRLGDHVSKDLTILFADIRGFTSMSETFGPGGTFKFLNGCLSRIVPHVHAHGGFIDKYIGDAVMALFPTSALGAVRAAIAIQKEVDAYNQEHGLTEDDADGLAIGVGIFRGPTMLGTIGEPRRFEATVISDAVNVAARLEALTRRLGVRVLIGESVLADLAESAVAMRPLGRVLARGRGEPVAIWELLDAESESVRRDKAETMETFLHAIDTFEKGSFSEAIAAFDQVLERSPNDGPSWVYQQACQRFLTNEIPFGFRGALDFGTDK